MAYDKLVCPNCSCPLTAPLSASQAQIACPRCETWLDLEARCNGVCLSCHAAKKPENTSSCADLSSQPVERFDKSPDDNSSGTTNAKNKDGSSGLKALFKRVFHV